MMKYLRLYGKFVEFSFGRAMEFRVDFFFRIFMDVVYYLVAFGFFKILYLHTPEIGEWNEQQAMIFISCYIMVDAIQMTFFANNSWYLPLLINSGDLDYYLVRPVSSFFFLNLREFAANSFFNLVIAFGIAVYTLTAYPEPLTWSRVLLFAILTVNGALIFQLIRIIAILPVFWTHGGRGFDMLFWNLVKLGERPHRIYTGVVKLTLMTILPFTLISSLPTEILFTDEPLKVFAICTAVSVTLFGVVLAFWNFALRNYSSASS